MLKGIDCVLIWTEDPSKLAPFYRDVLGLEIEATLNHPNDTGVLLKFPGNNVQLWIGKHSEVHGTNKDPQRHMINFFVDSVSKTYEELKSKGVIFTVEPFEAPLGGSWFATFQDPEGNILQLWSKNK